MRRFVQSNMLPKRSWARAFLVTLFFVTLASGLFWLDFFRGYQAEMTLLVIGKGELSGSAGEVASSLSELSQTLRFYDLLLERTEQFSDPYAGLSQDQRKKSFRSLFVAKRKPDSNIITLSVRSKDADDAKVLAQAGAETLFALTGFYYNIQTNVDVRVVEGPIVTATIFRPIFFLLTAFFSALFVTALF